MSRCASCGYGRSTHDPGTLKCHPATADKSGRRGTFKVPAPVELINWREVMRREAEARSRAIEEARKPYEPVVIPPPLVPARPPCGPHEYAVSNRGMSAVKLGRHAIAAGWVVEPAYWMAHDRNEGCALRLGKGAARAVALWSRTAANAGSVAGWKAEYAYAWRTDWLDRLPVKLNITELERFLDDEPEP
jgi:hypothetical protein